ncbi:MAG TPA: lysine-sensitive aspartokinase 3 [Candidatus Nanoarchaeia archaeon]|nr:lysine-sensitive aspartokinase 3 [Candidatus Nanoarchaeia archaeon]
MIVMKFGGTSVGSAERLKTVVHLIKEKQEDRPVVVLSAVSKMTDALIAAAYSAVHGKSDTDAIEQRHIEILDELGIDSSTMKPYFKELNNELQHISGFARLTPQLLDSVVSYGERLSVRMFSLYANSQGLSTRAVDAFEIGMLTDNRFGKSEVLPEAYAELNKNLTVLLNEGKIPIITGYIGKSKGGQITTLGRGGSDYSAAIIGAAIRAKEIQIWTDVNGVMTADPKIVPQAKTVELVSFDEASELSYFGAKVLHPKTLLPAMSHDIPVRVLNTFDPHNPGTKIVRHVANGKMIKAIASKKGVTLITIKSTRMLLAHGFLHRVFKVFDDKEVSVDMIATSEVSVSLTLDRGKDIEGVIKELQHFSEVRLEHNKASVSLVGEEIKGDTAIAQKIFNTLINEHIPVEMISQGASEISFGFVVDNSRADDAVRALHKTFFEVEQ